MQILPAASSTSAALLADIGSVVQPTITGVYAVVILAVALPLAFWLIHKLLALFPGRGGRRA